MDLDGLFELEVRLAALARSRGPLRVALAMVAAELVRKRAWERLAYARLSDYAEERLGISGRALQDLAHVGERLHWLPRLREALVSGRLGWTKVRLLARVAKSDDEERWIEFARGCSAAALARELRAVDSGSLEAGGHESGSAMFAVACTPAVASAWWQALHRARCLHGGRLPIVGCAEAIAAEVMSAIPLDAAPGPDPDPPNARSAELELPASEEVEAGPVECPEELAELESDLDEADAFELDRRLRALVALEQRLDARLGPLLEPIWRRRVYRMLGYPTGEAYARERLGLDPSWARALARIERAARASPVLARAYREGELSSLQALVLVPLLFDGSLHAAEWIEHARGTTLRSLRDAVERALHLREVDPEAFASTGGVPHGEAVPVVPEQEIGAFQSAAEETCTVRFAGCGEVVRLFRAVLCTVRRRIERETGRLPTQGQALGAMLDHVLREWGARDPTHPRRYRIFERDGWRCVVPGCTSMRNLQEHHVLFRSHGGGDEESNLVTLCAFHHLRGVHAGIVRVSGKAPRELRFELPLGVYRSGDRIIRARV